eukprot:10912808-Ditylum_brightwellii.AAC.1
MTKVITAKRKQYIYMWHHAPDYVRSVELPPGLEDDDILEEILERGGKDMLQGIYDSKCLPPDFGVSDGEIEEEEGR